jgi:hypothetical protein
MAMFATIMSTTAPPENAAKWACPDDGYCDSQMIAEWKMEAMGKLLLESLWTERKSAVQLACQMLRDSACDEPVKQGSSKLVTQPKINKVEAKIENLIEMRTEGEISKEEFLKQRAKLDSELKALHEELQAETDVIAVPKSDAMAWKAIEDTLNQLLDFSQHTLDKALYEKFVQQIIPRGDNRFAWVMNLDNGATGEYIPLAEGRKTSQKVSLDDSEGGDDPLHNIGVIYRSDFEKRLKKQKSSPLKFPHRRRLNPRRRKAKTLIYIKEGRFAVPLFAEKSSYFFCRIMGGKFVVYYCRNTWNL